MLAIKPSHLAVHNRIRAIVLIYFFVYDEKEDKTMAFFRMFKKSALELKSIRCIVVTALLIALELAIKMATVIRLGPDLKISFAFLAKASIGMLYGPTVGFLAGGVSDVVSFFMKPTGDTFSILFTLQECIASMIYGAFYYKLKMSKIEFGDRSKFRQSIKDNGKQLLRIIFGKLTVVVAINLIYTPLALIVSNSMAAGEWVVGSVIVKYPARLIKNAIQFPVDCVLLILVLPVVATAYYAVFRDSYNNKKVAVTVGDTDIKTNNSQTDGGKDFE